MLRSLLILAACSGFASAQEFESVRVTNGLYYPVGAEAAPGTVNRLYVHEQRGIIKIVDTLNGSVSGTFLNIDSKVGAFTGEGGLLGLAFHPDFANNRMFFVNYTNNSGNTVIARYTANNDDSASASSEEILMTVSQPYSNHNAGWLEFSPVDGYLYISMGDGGSGGDPGNRAQNINTKLGKILRINVDNPTGYTVPSDNPFVGVSGDDTIWSYGVRNAWKCCFDSLNGAMVMADVGQNAWEEVNYEPAGEGGRNYGWRCYEGNNGYNTSGCPSQSSLSFPVHTYSHSAGISITGGRVYRGPVASLYGRYFFADYASNQIWSINPEGGSLINHTSAFSPDVGGISRISGFAEDNEGNMYILDRGTSSTNGEVFAIRTTAPPTPQACCFSNGSCTQVLPADCAAAGGDGGFGEVCEPQPCPPPTTGACCISSSCAVLTPDACSASGGSFVGLGSECDTACAPAACCLGGSNCVVLVPTTCLAVGGEVAGGECTSSTCAPACPADLDGNGSVDFADLVSMLSGWGQPGAADLDESGLVDFNDVIILLGVWGECEG